MEFDKIVGEVLEEELSRLDRIKALKSMPDDMFGIGIRVIVNPGQSTWAKDRKYDIGGVQGTIIEYRPKDRWAKVDRWVVKLDAGYMFHPQGTGIELRAQDMSPA